MTSLVALEEQRTCENEMVIEPYCKMRERSNARRKVIQSMASNAVLSICRIGERGVERRTIRLERHWGKATEERRRTREEQVK